MATIRPFRAIRPAQDRSENLLDKYRHGLEPATGASPGHMEDCSLYLKHLLDTGELMQESSLALYVYERRNEDSSVTGIYALTSPQDLENGILHAHEDTREAPLAQLEAYRKNVGLEGSPVLLSHRPDDTLRQLLERAKRSCQPFCYEQDGVSHLFWRVNGPQEIAELQDALGAIDQVFLADGHHRLGAAASLHKVSPQWILSLYLSTEQLQLRPFHRMVLPQEGSHLFGASERIAEYFFTSLSRHGAPYRPGKKNRIGMCIGGTWYRLELRPELVMEDPIDADFLQRRILAPVFGIAEPGNDPRLRCYAEADWDRLLAALKDEKGAVAFTLAGISIEQLITLSLAGAKLPPKSTSIGPKPPFGLVMYSSKEIEREEDR